MSETKLGWTCASVPINVPINIPVYVPKRYSDQKRQVFHLFLLYYRKQVAKKVDIRTEKSGSIWDTFLKSKFAPALVCIHEKVFKFQVPVKPFRQNHGISQALELVHSQIARIWQMTKVGPIPGFIDLDLSLLLHQPWAKVRPTWWSGSGLSVIQALGESTLSSGKKTSIKRDFFGFCWRKPHCQVTTNCSTHYDLIPLLRKTVLNHLYSYNNGHWPCLIFHFKHELLIIGPSQISWSITYCSR